MFGSMWVTHTGYLLLFVFCALLRPSPLTHRPDSEYTRPRAQISPSFFFFSLRDQSTTDPEILVSPSPRFLWSGFSGEMWIYQNTHLLLIFWNNRLRINLIIIQGVDHWIKIKWRNHFHLIRDVDYCFITFD